MKFSDLSAQAQNEIPGTIQISGQILQMCDYMEQTGDHFFATAFPIAASDRSMLKSMGAEFGVMEIDGMTAVHLPLSMMKMATPARENDTETQAMIDRMVTALQSAGMGMIDEMSA